ncbi:MAG: dihydrolipoyl dehydrogenase [Bacillota bacterium]|nr:dihydrolipoyl dehydrogenase [Bacillota bacterium]
MEKYDVVVIGGGPGGYVAAIKAAHLGAKVALIEKEKLGGTCLNWGCIPTKALVKSASLWREIQHAEEYGFQVNEAIVNYSKVIERKDQVVATLVAGIEGLMKKNKITVISGIAKLAQLGKIAIDKQDGVTEEILAEKIIIATGSAPARLPIPGLDNPEVLNSDSALALTRIPESLLVIGGGVIGMEFASIFSAFGTKVTVVEMMPAILPMVDDELIRRFRPMLKKEGIDILTSAKVKEVKKESNSFKTVIETAKGDVEVITNDVLVAAGRVPVTVGIEVEGLGLEMEGRAIKVNEKMETNLPDVYAIGDVVGGAMLAHVASFEGIVAAENAMGHSSNMDYRVVPSCIFCHPEIASVGVTESEAKEQGIDFVVSKFPFTANGKALAIGEAAGTVKLIAEKATGIIIGGHIMGPHATDLIAEVGLAIKARLTGHQVAETIHAHPTLAETVMEAAHGLVDKPLHLA